MCHFYFMTKKVFADYIILIYCVPYSVMKENVVKDGHVLIATLYYNKFLIVICTIKLGRTLRKKKKEL